MSIWPCIQGAYRILANRSPFPDSGKFIRALKIIFSIFLTGGLFPCMIFSNEPIVDVILYIFCSEPFCSSLRALCSLLGKGVLRLDLCE